MQTNKQEKTHFYCKSAGEVPKTQHWAIITSETGQEPGYNPGDSPTSFSYVTYEAFLKKEEWEAEVTSRTKDNIDRSIKKYFTAMEVKPAAIITSISVAVG